MKRMKLIASVILVIVLALALSVSAFAAGSIKIAEPVTGSTYQIYKVFDVAQNGDNLVYTLTNPSAELKAVFMDDSGNSKIPGLTFTASGSDYTVTKVAGFNSANFAETLKENAGKLGTPTTIDGTETPAWKATGLANGYYLIAPRDGSDFKDKAALTTVLDNEVTVQDKNDMPFDKVIVDGTEEKKEDTIKVGDTVNYKITGKVPTHSTGITFSSYIVHDKMDAGLTFNRNVVVKIYNKATSAWDTIPLEPVTNQDDLLTGDQIRYPAGTDDSYTKNGYSFELSIETFLRGTEADTTKDYIGSDIEITYSATVNDKALSKISENHAHLEYSDDNKTYTKDESTKVYPVTIIIDKFETGAPEQKLSGAEFVLYRLATDEDVAAGIATAVGDKLYYRYDATAKEVTWITSDDPAANGKETVAAATDITKVITDTDGAASFDYMEDGTYYLHEIKAPTGYTLLDEDIPVTVNGSGATDPTLTGEQVAQLLTSYVHVSNTPESILPSTGGSGTTMLYVAGLVLVLAAGAFLFFRKRGEAK